MLVSMKTPDPDTSSFAHLAEQNEFDWRQKEMPQFLIDGLNSSTAMSPSEAVDKLRVRHFNHQYGDWIAQQNSLTEKHGIFGEEFRAW